MNPRRSWARIGARKHPPGWARERPSRRVTHVPASLTDDRRDENLRPTAGHAGAAAPEPHSRTRSARSRQTSARARPAATSTRL